MKETETQKAIEAEAIELYPYPEYKNGGGYSDEDYREFYKTVCEHIDYKRKAFVAGRSKALEEKDKRIKKLEDGIQWALDNPQSVFVFNELQKLLKS